MIWISTTNKNLHGHEASIYTHQRLYWQKISISSFVSLSFFLELHPYTHKHTEFLSRFPKATTIISFEARSPPDIVSVIWLFIFSHKLYIYIYVYYTFAIDLILWPFLFAVVVAFHIFPCIPFSSL